MYLGNLQQFRDNPNVANFALKEKMNETKYGVGCQIEGIVYDQIETLLFLPT